MYPVNSSGTVMGSWSKTKGVLSWIKTKTQNKNRCSGWRHCFTSWILANLQAIFFYSTGEKKSYRWIEKERRCTFLIDPLHCEELVIVHGAHVPHLPVQAFIGDGWLKVSDHDVPAEKKCNAWLHPTHQRNQCTVAGFFFFLGMSGGGAKIVDFVLFGSNFI